MDGKKKRPVLQNSALMILLIGTFYFYNNYINAGGFDIGYQYLFSIGIIIIGFWYILKEPDLDLFIAQFRLLMVLSLPYIANIVYSFGIWIFNLSDFRIMTRGMFSSIYSVIGIATAAVVTYLLREKAVTYSFTAVTAAFIIMFLEQTRIYGLSHMAGELMDLILSMSKVTGPAMVKLEDSRLAYAFVILLIYCCCHFEWTPGKLAMMCIAVFCFLLGMKRSAMLAFFVAMSVGLLYMRCPLACRKYVVRLTIFGTLGFAMLYIPFIRFGFLEKMVERFGIDTSSRTRIYDVYKQFYEFSPFYMGKGLGWIQRRVSDHMGVTGRYTLAFYDVHNDYLRMFIELGFWGYVSWLLLMFPAIAWYTLKRTGRKGGAVVLGAILFLFVTYMTENVYYSYPTIIFFSLVIFNSLFFCGEKDGPGNDWEKR